MILEQNVKILVMLSELGDGQSKCFCYWPKGEQIHDYVKIIPESEEELDNYMIRRFSVVNIKVCSAFTKKRNIQCLGLSS